MKTYTKPVVNFNKDGNTKDVKTLEDIDTKTLFRINPNYLLRQVADDYVIILEQLWVDNVYKASYNLH